jgi:hypothetical protein
LKCYSPTTVAERCYLSAAIFWLLLRVVPIADYNLAGSGEDNRFSSEEDGSSGFVASFTDLTDFDCEKLGIPPNPASSLYNLDVGAVNFTVLDLLDKYKDDDEAYYEGIKNQFLENDINEARILREQFDVWVKTVETLIELPKSQILQAILKKELPTFCRNELQYVYDFDENPENVDPHDNGWFADRGDTNVFVEAPIEIFKATSINWEESSSVVEKLCFRDICVDTAALLHVFPDPDEHTVSVVCVGDVLFSKDGDLSTPERPQRGRPSYPWAEMHQELGRWIERGDIPEKKEALIAKLMEWCKLKWRRDVSRAAIQLQIRGF